MWQVPKLHAYQLEPFLYQAVRIKEFSSQASGLYSVSRFISGDEPD